MSDDPVNKWLTLGANVGVLIGIVLLVVELNQSREMVVAQTRHAISTEYTSFMLATADSPELADIIIKKVSGEETTPQENLRYQFRLNAWFAIASNLYYQYRSGLYDEDEFRAIKATWRGFANASPAIAEHWCRFRDQHHPEFRGQMEPLFSSLPCQYYSTGYE